MKCGLCNNELILKKGDVEFDSRSLGKVLVPNLKFYECKACGDKLLSPKESDKAIEYIKKLENQLVKRLPIGEFITANEASEILGITKQAFSKHPKIKRGLIYSTKIGDRKYYLEQSVKLFKEKKNGKFPLTEQEDIIIATLTADDDKYVDIIEIKDERAFSVGGLQHGTNQTSDSYIPSLLPISNTEEVPKLDIAA